MMRRSARSGVEARIIGKCFEIYYMTVVFSQILPNPTSQSVSPAVKLITKDKKEHKNKDAVLVNINFEDQDVLCSNCYETIPMTLVDSHSMSCVKE